MKLSKKQTLLLPIVLSGSVLTSVFVGNLFVEDSNTSKALHETVEPRTYNTLNASLADPISAPASQNTDTTALPISKTGTNNAPPQKVSENNTQKSDAKNSTGQWHSEEYDEESKLISTLSLEIDAVSEDSISGNYCYISRYGNKTDCFNDFDGVPISTEGGSGQYLINFTSSFKNLAGQATLKLDEDELIWNLKLFPDDTGVSIPKYRVLKRNNTADVSDDLASSKSIDLSYIINKEQAVIYSEPLESKKTNSYYIKDDVIKGLSKNDNWISITYKNQSKIGWLKISDLDKQ